MTPLLVARDVEARYAADGPVIVSGVDLEIGPGQAVGIVGESGSGKTTLARLLVGAIAPSAGEVLIEGRPWSSVSRRDELRRKVQMVFQDPHGALNPRLTALDMVAEAIRFWERLPRRLATERAKDLLGETGLPLDAMRRRPGELSGGQCQRVGIARALACGPAVLVADEPTSALDVSVQAQILNLLLDLQETRQLAVVLISHDLGVVRYATDRALVMYRGRVVERRATEELLDAPAHPYTRVLIDSIPGSEGPVRAVHRELAGEHPCVFADRCPYLLADCVSLEVAAASSTSLEIAVACVHPLRGDPPPVAAIAHQQERER
jgi:oligopeptide/dipeptide ABC transporter ATP-binding protein